MNLRPFCFSQLALLLAAGIFALPVAGLAQSGAADAQGSTKNPPSPAPSPPPAKDDFAQMDLNHDGRISPAEYAASPQSAVDRIAGGKRQGPAGPTGGFDLKSNEGRPERSKFFKKLDLNGDGFISRDELLKSEAPKK